MDTPERERRERERERDQIEIYLRVGLLELVEEDDGVGAAAHSLGEHSALLVSHVARRRADQPRYAVRLHELAARVRRRRNALTYRNNNCYRYGQRNRHSDRDRYMHGRYVPHINADDSGLVVEQEPGQRLAELRLAHSGGAQEQERAQRTVRVVQSRARDADDVAGELSA
jgi:hypothetical protein